jgi:hypothetical protein
MSRAFKFAMLSVALLAIGCDTKKVTDAVNSTVDSAKNTVNKTVEAAKQEINLAGSMEVSTTPPVSAKACYAKIVIPGGQRSSVLQLASYKTADLERFPSMFLQAPVKVDAASKLVGQTLQAELFALASADGAIWRTRTGAPAALIVSAVDDQSLTAQCTGATLVNSETGEEISANGKFIALFE